MRSLLSSPERKVLVREHGERTGIEANQPRSERLNGRVVPRSPLAAVVGLAVLVLLARSLAKAG
jgi:hypothetical protein